MDITVINNKFYTNELSVNDTCFNKITNKKYIVFYIDEIYNEYEVYDVKSGRKKSFKKELLLKQL